MNMRYSKMLFIPCHIVAALAALIAVAPAVADTTSLKNPDNVRSIGPKPDDPRSIGPKPDDPRNIGPKPDDPRAIGPKPDDPFSIGPKPDDPLQLGNPMNSSFSPTPNDAFKP
jgi:hypothetical protein